MSKLRSLINGNNSKRLASKSHNFGAKSTKGFITLFLCRRNTVAKERKGERERGRDNTLEHGRREGRKESECWRNKNDRWSLFYERQVDE